MWLALLFAAIRRRDPLKSMLLAGIAQMLLFGIWFEFDERHRYFLTPILLLCASAGLLSLLTRMRSGTAPTVASVQEMVAEEGLEPPTRGL